MRIISKVEINYFRSVYSVSLSELSDISILVGGNDTGKSNILKALNLFFNNETELGRQYFFGDDLCRVREVEARSAKGRATIWMKVHFQNFLNWRSLPDEFVIKKTWNRYSSQPEIALPTEVSAISIGKFLNKLAFHYVPAIRGRDIFAHFLTLLHDALVDDEKAGMVDAAGKLMDAVNQSTADMSERIQTGIGIDSTIQPPTDLRDLFSALDFSTDHGGHDIPLQKRGDGIQSRYIPFILDFVARHSNKHHIWAYEEPETSLEMGPAFELANQFKDDFSTDNQVFLTTHSPAFYDIEGERVTKWWVYQMGEADQRVTSATGVESTDLMDGSLGVAPLIAKRAKDAYDRITELHGVVESLDAQITASERAHVIVEGKTDKMILETAFRKLRPDAAFNFECVYADSASNITPYLKSLKVLSKHASRSVIGLYDRDRAGRKEMREFKSASKVKDTSFVRLTANRQIYAGLLPLCAEIQDIERHMQQASGNVFEAPITIEYMFPPSVIERAASEGVLLLEDRIGKINDPEFPTDVNMTEVLGKSLPEHYVYLSKKVVKSTKVAFAKWVDVLDADDFRHFGPLFDDIDTLIN